uniref:Uncharacterized protein n=1 Tax=Arundo donax TaxID=35708 RepID=A0A0A9FUH0_ARUDO
MILAGIYGSKSSARLTISNICRIRIKHTNSIFTRNQYQLQITLYIHTEQMSDAFVSVRYHLANVRRFCICTIPHMDASNTQLRPYFEGPQLPAPAQILSL